jgi:hypothetical protein
LMEAFVFCKFGFAGVVDGVSEALGDDVIEIGVDVGLESEHVGGSELIFCSERFFGENFPDALVAVGRAPVERDGIGVVVRGDAIVGCG